MLLAAEGTSNKEIAARLDTSPQTVCKWRKRFYEEGLGGLEDRPRSGRPPTFSPRARMEVKALACELPATTGVPLSRWSAEGRWHGRRSIGASWGRDLGDHRLALALRGRHPALLPPLVDLPSRPRLRGDKPLGCWTSTRVGGR